MHLVEMGRFLCIEIIDSKVKIITSPSAGLNATQNTNLFIQKHAEYLTFSDISKIIFLYFQLTTSKKMQRNLPVIIEIVVNGVKCI